LSVMEENKTLNIPQENLRRLLRDLFAGYGCRREQAQAVSDSLVETSLRGVDSHGVRLVEHYLHSMQMGSKNPAPRFRKKQKYASVGQLDADGGFCQYAGQVGGQWAVELAQEYGQGSVSITDTTHPGALATYAEMMVKEDCLVMVMGHSDSLMVPHGGVRPFLGTNPFCMAFPRKNQQQPLCLDMATTTIPWNRVKMARQRGISVPPGVCVDDKGVETCDPHQAVGLYPLGSSASYKGHGLAMACEFMCSLFNGMPFGPQIIPMFGGDPAKRRQLGLFLWAIKVDCVVAKAEYFERVEEFVETYHAEASQPGEEILLPGEKENRCRQKRQLDGIPVEMDWFERVLTLARPVVPSCADYQRVP
jgi:ureidoglycolate dehydrogenase (NAD+)